MPRSKAWIFVETFNNFEELEEYLLRKVATANCKTNKMKCNLCKPNVDNHQMSYKIRLCNSELCNSVDSKCLFEYKILACHLTSEVNLYSINDHIN